MEKSCVADNIGKYVILHIAMRHRFFLFTFLLLIAGILIINGYYKIPMGNLKKDGQTVTVTGNIYRPVKAKEGCFLLKQKSSFILLTVENLSDEINILLSKGAMVKITLTLNLPDEETNFNTFDYRKYLFSRKIFYESTISCEDIEIIKKNPIGLRIFGARIRYAFNKVTEKYLDSDSAAFTEAIITGETGLMDDNDKELIRISGVSHLVAVSGMHVMYFIAPVKKLLKNKKTGIRVRNLILIPFLLLFASIADMSPSVLRAVISATIVCTASVLEKPLDKFNAFGLTGTILLIYNPYYIYSSGFVMSFLCIFSIYSIVPFIQRKSEGTLGVKYKEKNVFNVKKYLIDSILTSVGINIMLLPVCVWYYGEISILGIILNIPASPLTCIIFLLGFSLVILSGLNFGIFASFLSYILSFICKIFGIILDIGKILSERFGVYNIPRPSLWLICIWYSVIFLIVFGKKFCNKRRIAFYICFLIIFALNINLSYKSETKITCFDVGQGSSIIIESGEKVIVIDTGEGSVDISELIYKSGNKKIDYLILSHGHSDHASGMDEIIENCKICNFIYPDNSMDTTAIAYGEALGKMGVKTYALGGNYNIKLGENEDISIFYQDFGEDLNNSSLMVIYNKNGVKILFGADIQSERESSLVKSGLLQDVDILIVPHHGSKYSSTEEFLDKIKPEYAIIQVGKFNLYGHPSDEALERLEKCGSIVYRTDENGAVCIKIDLEGKINIWPKIS